MPPNIRHRDLPHTAWIQAIAFASTARRKDGTPRHDNPRAWALAAWPAYLFTHTVIGHRNLYLTPSRQGVIGMYQSPAWGLLARVAAFAAPALAINVALRAGDLIPGQNLAVTVVAASYLALIAPLVIAASFSGRRSHAPAGTPKLKVPIKHVTLGLAAAHPDAPRGETFGHARHLMNDLPPGATVITHPRTPRLRERYEDEGFKRSRGVAMVKHIENTDAATPGS